MKGFRFGFLLLAVVFLLAAVIGASPPTKQGKQAPVASATVEQPSTAIELQAATVAQASNSKEIIKVGAAVRVEQQYGKNEVAARARNGSHSRANVRELTSTTGKQDIGLPLLI